MQTIQTLLSFFLHLDVHMVSFVAQHGAWVYGVLFLIIFCETGLVFFPFLPGDSLLFAAGALAAKAPTEMNIGLLFILLLMASLLGNQLNYLVGKFIGPRLFRSHHSIFLNKKYLDRASQFYRTYGAKTIILARFIPIVRSFAPFVAGIGSMSSQQFSLYNLIGGVTWVGGILYASFLFGNLPFIRDHFSTIILGIIGVSLLPMVIEVARQAFFKTANKTS
jgi:membrane-associated protein